MMYPDHCCHGDDTFYRTVYLRGQEGDLYFYTDRYEGGDMYCFRYGPNGEDYRSMPMKYLIGPSGFSDTFSREDIIEFYNSDMTLIKYYLNWKGVIENDTTSEP